MSCAPYNLENHNVGYYETVPKPPSQYVPKQSHNLKVHGIQVSGKERDIQENFACENGLDLACPHAGCQVNKQGDKYVCPCHNSQFKLDGTLIQGPATTGLRKCQE